MLKLKTLLQNTIALNILALPLLATPSLAACTNPTGVEGQIIYNRAWKTMQFCNDTAWIGMNGGANASAAGAQGNIQFRGSTNSLDATPNLTWNNTQKFLGIGTNTPISVLTVTGTSSLGEFIGKGDSTLGTYQNYIRGRDETGNTIWYIGDASVDKRVILATRGPESDYYPFDIEVANQNAIRILPNGNVGIFAITPQTKLHVTGTIMAAASTTQPSLSLSVNTPRAIMSDNGALWSTTAGEVNLHLHRVNTTNQYVRFGYNNSLVGSISTTGTNTAYNTTSDKRLKHNITPTTKGLDTLTEINVHDFSFKSDPDDTIVQGFLAQDLYEIYPEAVTPGNDDTQVPWNVDYGRLTPLLLQSIKDLKAQNDALITHINTLETRIKTLEDK